MTLSFASNQSDNRGNLFTNFFVPESIQQNENHRDVHKNLKCCFEYFTYIVKSLFASLDRPQINYAGACNQERIYSIRQTLYKSLQLIYLNPI